MDLNAEKERLMCSLLEFTKVFFHLRTGKKFDVSLPNGRESHYLSICNVLTKVMTGETRRLIIQIPPRYGKTELVMHFVAWAMAQYPDSQFLYVSYSLGLAKKATKTIKRIMSLIEYKELFDVHIPTDSRSQGNFETQYGGTIYAAGANGEITGRGAGLQDCPRFGGAIIIDDIHKPSLIHSDSIRQSTKDWYKETLMSRSNDPKKTPIILIGQSLHEDDLPENLKREGGWEKLVLPALDETKNALDPSKHTREMLEEMEKKSKYVFWSQYQQNPIPAGGALWQKDWFVLKDDEPAILKTFITIDTAETSKTYNDATVFSFWGLYKLGYGDIQLANYGLHWIDCLEVRIEPHQLEEAFMQFFYGCCRHACPPQCVVIEKKSTGVTLQSVLKQVQGLQVVDIERSIASGSKADRYVSIQNYISAGYISLPEYERHTKHTIDHCASITANNTHRHDDIADTLYDAVKIALIDKYFHKQISVNEQQKIEQSTRIADKFSQQLKLRDRMQW